MRSPTIFLVISRSIFSPIAIALCTASSVVAQQAAAPDSSTPAVRYVEENGIRYMETRRMVKQPVRDFRYVDTPQTYYLQRYRTDYVNQTSVRHVPNTKYECVPRLYDWWRVLGVLGEPYVAYGMEPLTTWQAVPQTAPVALTRREVVPQSRTVKVAVPFVRMVEKEQISRVAVGPATNRSAGAPKVPSASQVAQARYPGAPQTRLATQPAFVPVGGAERAGVPGAGSRANVTNVNRESIDPSVYNPFGGWGVANRRQNFGSGTSGSGDNNPQVAGRSGGAINQDSSMPGQGLSGRFGGIARMDGDYPRYGTGPPHVSGSNSTLQATRPQP